MSSTIVDGPRGRVSTDTGVISTPSMTVRFKMDITTSGTNQGLFITTGIQAGGSQAAMQQPWGYFHAQQSYPVIGAGAVTDRSVTAISPYTMPAIKDVTAPTIGSTTVDESSRFNSLKRNTTVVDEKIKAASDFDIDKYLTGVGDPRPSSRPTSRPSSPLRGFSGRDSSPDSFVQPGAVQLNLFNDVAPCTSNDIRKNPYVEHPTDYMLNDTTTTTTTVEIFRARADEEDPVDFYQLPPEPFSTTGIPQLVRARGPAYEVETSTQTHFADVPPKAVQWDGESRRTQSAASEWGITSPWVSEEREENSSYRRSQLQTSFQDDYTTIMRKQWNRRDEERIMDVESASKYAGRPVTPVVSYAEDHTSGRDRPPLPRKPKALHHTKSHQDIFDTDDYETPRMSPRYRDVRSRDSRSEFKASSLPRARATSQQRLQGTSDDWDSRYPRVPSRPSSRSASSNEIFKLYQTRDCLGNVLYELPIDEALSYGYNDTPLLLSPVGESEDSFIDNLSARSFRQTVEHARPSDYRNLYRTKPHAESGSKQGLHLDPIISTCTASSGYSSQDKDLSDGMPSRSTVDSTRSSSDIGTTMGSRRSPREKTTDTTTIREAATESAAIPLCTYSEDNISLHVAEKRTSKDTDEVAYQSSVSPCFRSESPSYQSLSSSRNFICRELGLPPLPPTAEGRRRTNANHFQTDLMFGGSKQIGRGDRRTGGGSVCSDSEPEFFLTNITEPASMYAIADRHRLLLVPEEH